MTVRLDHIVVPARSLEEGVAHLRARCGVEMGPGGTHRGFGTHNRLARIGEGIFLELIARNPAEQAPDRPLWFGLDAPPEPPRLAAWVLNSDDLDADLATARSLGQDLGTPLAVSRQHLSWRFALPAQGRAPLQGAAPYLMQWDVPEPHPSTAMADPGLRLERLTIATPEAEALAALLRALGFSDPRVAIGEAPETRFSARLTAPGGRRIELT